MRLPLLVLIPLVFSACDRGPTSPDTIENHRQAWRALARTSYNYRLSRECFCLATGPHRVTVDNGIVVSVVSEATGLDVAPDEMQWFPTVEGLFDQVLQAQAQGAALLEVTYHPSEYYPSEIYIDWISEAIDDELRLLASDVRDTGAGGA